MRLHNIIINNFYTNTLRNKWLIRCAVSFIKKNKKIIH
jgi:hypothetical protein